LATSIISSSGLTINGLMSGIVMMGGPSEHISLGAMGLTHKK
jgi:hypothetical protein